MNKLNILIVLSLMGALASCRAVGARVTPEPPEEKKAEYPTYPANTIAILIKGNNGAIEYLLTPTYSTANVIQAAVNMATGGTEEKPDNIIIIEDTYTLLDKIDTSNKHVKIYAYSGKITINRNENAKTYPIIQHDSGTLVLGDGYAERVIVLDGGGGDANDRDFPPLFTMPNDAETGADGKVTLKDGVEITGGTNRGIIANAGVLNITGGVVRGNKSPVLGGGVVSIGVLTKTGGTIYGNDAANTADKNTTEDSIGHAVLFVTDINDMSSIKIRNTTADSNVNLNSSTQTNWDS